MRYGSVQACFGSETLLSVVLGALSDTFSLVWVDDALVPGLLSAKYLVQSLAIIWKMWV